MEIIEGGMAGIFETLSSAKFQSSVLRILVIMNAMVSVSVLGKLAGRVEKTTSVGQSRCIEDANLSHSFFFAITLAVPSALDEGHEVEQSLT